MTTRAEHNLRYPFSLAALLCVGCATTLPSAPHPPIARIEPHTTTWFGQERVDPYGWMRDGDDVRDEVLRHLRAENAWANHSLAPTRSLQRTLFREFVARVAPEDQSLPVHRDGATTWQRLEPERRFPLYLFRRDTDDQPSVLLDADARAGDRPYYEATGLTISPSHTALAWAEDTTGRGIYDIHIRPLDGGPDPTETLPGTAGNPVWLDEHTLAYTRLDPQTLRASTVHLHTLGTPPASDHRVHEEPDPRFHLWLRRSRSGQWVFIEAYSHRTSDVAILSTLTPDAPVRPLLPRREGHHLTAEHLDDTFYLRTNLDAPNFRLVATDLDLAEQPERWHTIVPHDPDGVLERFELFDHHLVTTERADGLTRLRIRPRHGGPPLDVPLTDAASWSTTLLANPDPTAKSVRVRVSSFAQPDTTLEVALDTTHLQPLRQLPLATPFDPRRYRTERLFAHAPDGTPIPISLVHRNDIDPTQPRPLYLRVYGAYGEPYDPRFSRPLLSLLDRGFVFGIAHVRGGGEYGRRWHDGGRGPNRPQTFSDLIACAEHLIASGWTEPRRLFIGGGSAGGTAVAAAANLRPELFAGVVADVPFVDVLGTLLDPTLPLTATDRDEWGDPTSDLATFDAIRAWSPYDNVHHAPYPPILIHASLHDGRVPWWEPARWAARLRAHSTSNAPVLLITDLDAGHHGPATTADAWRQTARTWAFLLTTLPP